jgi:catechol 2,3-dioxygenase
LRAPRALSQPVLEVVYAAGMDGVKVSLSHLGVSVLDFDRMLAFYTETLGMVVSDTDHLPFGNKGRIAFLTTNPTDHHQLVIVEGRDQEELRTDAPFGGSVGSQLFQMSFRLPDLATMKMVKARLVSAGLDNFAPMNHGNAWALYVRDPEGNALEFFVDSPWYVRQPCGFPLDLSLSDQEILAETEAYCTAQPECMPMDAWQSEQAVRIRAAQALLA